MRLAKPAAGKEAPRPSQLAVVGNRASSFSEPRGAEVGILDGSCMRQHSDLADSSRRIAGLFEVDGCTVPGTSSRLLATASLAEAYLARLHGIRP